jgi:Vitamin K-dependent gamma-carboxylase
MNPLRDWGRFLFGPISARPLGVFRIVFGVLILHYLALMSVEFDHWYTGAGLLHGAEAREAAAPLRISPLQYVDNPQIAHAVFAFTVMVTVGFTLGWHTRIMSILLWACLLSFYHRNVGSNGGPDALPPILSFYMMLCPCGAACSLDALRAARKRGTAAEPLIVPWALRLLQMQICLLYFQSCVIKCQGGLWQNGTVVHYILFLREFRVFDAEWLAQYPLVINGLTHGALLIEFALAFWLWFRPVRRWAIVGGVLLHLGIRPILNVPGFGEILIATYVMFLAPDELDAVLRFIDPRRVLARLGVQLPVGPLWNTASRGTPIVGVHQLELPFEGGSS